MLGRKATRIDLKPEDREEYFAHKHRKEEAPADAQTPKPDPKDEKHARIGLKHTR